MSEANESSSVVHIHAKWIFICSSYTSLLFYMSGCSEAHFCLSLIWRQKWHHVRNIPDGIQLIRSNLLRRNRAVTLSPIYHFGLPRKCHRANQPTHEDGIFWDRQFADAQSDETYKADFTLVGDIDIGLSWSPPIRPHFGLEDFGVPYAVMKPTGLSCQGVTAEVLVESMFGRPWAFYSEIYLRRNVLIKYLSA